LWMFNGFTYIRWDGQVWSEVETVPAYPSANFNTNITADSSDIIWNGCDNAGLRCSNGVYFIRMKAESFEANERIILVK